MSVSKVAVWAFVSVFALGACTPAEEPEDLVDEVAAIEAAEPEPTPEPEPPREPPQWEQSVSVADFSRCKLADPRPASVRQLVRGERQGDIIGMEAVGFPHSERELPGSGEANVIIAKVAFNDAPPSDELPESFLTEQTDIVTEWSEFFSQGKFRLTFQVVPGWVTVPVDHADYTLDPGVGDNEYDQNEWHRQAQSRMEQVAKLVVEQLPDDLDYQAADAVFIYWTPEMFAFKQTVSDRDGVFSTPQGSVRLPFQAGGVYHTTDSGGLTFESKKEYAWSYFIHDLSHWMGMNGHAPGNGWKTGVGQGAYPGNGEYSGVLTAWETFLFEWFDDEQVFCADLETLTEPQRVMLTPLETYGGERKMVAIRTVDHKVLVVESRRPIGWSEDWNPANAGLLVYEIDANGVQTDHLPDDCGNDREKPKWAYYIYPDSVTDRRCVHNDIENMLVREGMSVTHSGVKITLDFLGDDVDYVLIEPADDDA